MKKIIEESFPWQDLHGLFQPERAGKGRPADIHVWWNRSPIASSMAYLYALLTDAPQTDAVREETSGLLCGLATQDATAVTQAGQSLAEKDIPLLVDSFSGFGGLALAAEKLGLTMAAGDLNAVATVLTQAVADFPARFATCSPVHLGWDMEEKGPRSIAADLVYYGAWLKEKAAEQLAAFYPHIYDQVPSAWVWVRTVPCPNPACRCEMPLANTFVLSEISGKEYWAEPVQDQGQLHFHVHAGRCPQEKRSNKVSPIGAKFRCPVCGEITTPDYVREMGRQGSMSLRMMAVMTHGTDGKYFYEPDAIQELGADVMRPRVPELRLADNSRWFSTLAYGMTTYNSLYTARQLTMLTIFSQLIKDVTKEATRDAQRAGIAMGEPLQDGGQGALAYGQMIGVYLSLAISKMSNYNSSLCGWDHRQGIGAVSIMQHALPMIWTFVEGNPFTKATGNFSTIITNMTAAVANLPAQGHISVSQGDAVSRTYPQDIILFTELPFYDNVGYADISDYFYFWLRQCLQDTVPDWFQAECTEKDELSSVAAHYGGDASKARQAYLGKMQTFFDALAPVVTKAYPSLVFFAFSDDDAKICRSETTGTTTGHLIPLLHCMVQAGFGITALWPA